MKIYSVYCVENCDQQCLIIGMCFMTQVKFIEAAARTQRCRQVFDRAFNQAMTVCRPSHRAATAHILLPDVVTECREPAETSFFKLLLLQLPPCPQCDGAWGSFNCHIRLYFISNFHVTKQLKFDLSSEVCNSKVVLWNCKHVLCCIAIRVSV